MTATGHAFEACTWCLPLTHPEADSVTRVVRVLKTGQTDWRAVRWLIHCRPRTLCMLYRLYLHPPLWCIFCLQIPQGQLHARHRQATTKIALAMCEIRSQVFVLP